MKYRKKPVVIEAEQFIIRNFNHVPIAVVIMGSIYVVKGESFNRYIEIPTLEGTMRANHLDYIIKGVNGEIYPCKPDIFRKTYELVEEPENDLDFSVSDMVLKAVAKNMDAEMRKLLKEEESK